MFPCRRAERSVFEGLRGCVSSEGLWRKPAALLQAPGSSVAELLKRQPLGLGKACSCELAVLTEGCNPRADSGRARCRSWAGGLAAARQRRTAPPLLPPRLLLLLLLSLPAPSPSPPVKWRLLPTGSRKVPLGALQPSFSALLRGPFDCCFFPPRC